MPKHNETLLTDPRSYESADGDILPFADIEEPRLWDTKDVEFDEALDPDEGRSEAFIKVRDIIEAGIEKSANYNEFKVEFEQDGETVRMNLAKFISGNTMRRMVSPEEYKELFETYRAKAIEKTVQRLGVTATKAPLYVSGNKPYRDFQSAASNDDTLKD